MSGPGGERGTTDPPGQCRVNQGKILNCAHAAKTLAFRTLFVKDYAPTDPSGSDGQAGARMNRNGSGWLGIYDSSFKQRTTGGNAGAINGNRSIQDDTEFVAYAPSCLGCRRAFTDTRVRSLARDTTIESQPYQGYFLLLGSHHADERVHSHVGDRLDLPVRPDHRQRDRALVRRQSEIHAVVPLGVDRALGVAHPARESTFLRYDVDASTDGFAVTRSANQITPESAPVSRNTFPKISRATGSIRLNKSSASNRAAYSASRCSMAAPCSPNTASARN